MHVFAEEMKRSLRSWLSFTLAISGTLVVFGVFFRTLRADAQLLNDILENFPLEFRAAFGFADVDMATIEGYFAFLLGYITLIGAVFALKQSLTLLSEEGRRKTTDFLLTKPIGRARIFRAKFTAVLVQIVVQNILLWITAFVFVRFILEEPMSPRLMLLMTGSVFFVQLFFVGLGFAVAAAAQKLKSAVPLTLGIVFFFFALQMLHESLRDRKLSFLTPFAYFKGSDLIRNVAYDAAYIAATLIVFAGFSLLAWLIYRKKDFAG